MNSDDFVEPDRKPRHRGRKLLHACRPQSKSEDASTRHLSRQEETECVNFDTPISGVMLTAADANELARRHTKRKVAA